jgi:tetratricopeptide (TPR) repeat protein
MWTVEKKLRSIREHLGISQVELAKLLDCSIGTISNLEGGIYSYSKEQLAMVRKFFGVETAPLLDGEEHVYRARLQYWRELIRYRRLEEAREMYPEMSAIRELPYHVELGFQFAMYEVKLLLEEENFELARKMLYRVKIQAADYTSGIGDANLYHYFFNYGVYYYYVGKYKKSLENYEKARKIGHESDSSWFSLFYNMSLVYGKLGMYLRAIIILEQALHLDKCDAKRRSGVGIYGILGLNYMRIGETEKAREHLDVALSRARAVGDVYHIAIVLHNYGCTYLKTMKTKYQEHKEAIYYFDRAMELFEEGSDNYLESMYYKAFVLVITRKTPARKEAFEEIRTLIKKYDNPHYKRLFDTLSHVMTIKYGESIYFIEETIEYLEERHEYFKALKYYDILESLYKRRNSKKMSLYYALKARDIYKYIIQGGNV